MFTVDNKFEVGQEVYIITNRPEWQRIPCPTCNGKQIIIYRNPDEDKHTKKHMQCPKCDGRGIFDRHTTGFHISGLHTIKSISFRVTENKVFVRYNLSNYGALEEEKIFATKKEANAEYERLNDMMELEDSTNGNR